MLQVAYHVARIEVFYLWDTACSTEVIRHNYYEHKNSVDLKQSEMCVIFLIYKLQILICKNEV